MKVWKSLKSTSLKRIIGAVMALGLAIGTIQASTFLSDAVEKVDLSKTCALTVTASASTDEEFINDIASANVIIDAYLVAKAEMAVNAVDGYTFDVADDYKSVIDIPEDADSKTFSQLAYKAAEVVKKSIDAGTAIEPTVSFEAGKNATGLDAGLYLLIARGEGVSEYFDYIDVESTDDKGAKTTESRLVSLAYSDTYVYEFAPEFVSIPTKDPDPLTGEIDQLSDSDWLYSATVAMKPSREPRYGSLKIIKDLLSFETSEPAYFIFKVEATVTENGVSKSVFSNVYSLKFTAAGEEYLLIDNIPAGATVTVKEVYSGANYVCKTSDTDTVVIKANEIAAVSFTNDYEGTEKHCGAITNHFDYTLDDDGNPVWNWHQYGDSREEGAQ